MKKAVLTLVAALTLLGSAKAEDYIYNGAAHVTVMTSEKGAVTVKSLAEEKGYEVLACQSGHALVKKYGRTYKLSRIEVNNKGLITFALFEMIK